MSHPILGFELGQLRRESLQFSMHNIPKEIYALRVSNFVTEEWESPGVLEALAALILAGTTPSGDGE